MIINLSSYKTKSYDSVLVSDPKISYFQKGEDTDFHSFLYCILFIHVRY